MKTLLLTLTLSLPLMATDSTATITTPDADAPLLVAVYEKWIQEQNKETIKYPGVNVTARRQALLDHILRVGTRAVLLQACVQFPADCADLTGHKNAAAASDAAATAWVENIIQ